jgi:hypothetical protein
MPEDEADRSVSCRVGPECVPAGIPSGDPVGPGARTNERGRI